MNQRSVKFGFRRLFFRQRHWLRRIDWNGHLVSANPSIARPCSWQFQRKNNLRKPTVTDPPAASSPLVDLRCISTGITIDENIEGKCAIFAFFRPVALEAIIRYHTWDECPLAQNNSNKQGRAQVLTYIKTRGDSFRASATDSQDGNW